MANKCKECGCTCKRCISDHDVQLHVEIENLKQRLLEKETHIVTMETNFLNEANKFPSGELVAVREELLTWQDKYKRLYEAHRRVQRVNQGLEDKLLKLVDVCETEKNALTRDVATLSHKLAEANYAVKKLSEDNERYKNDVALAIQFLQCKQSNFVAHKFDSLSPEVQSQVSNFMTHKKKPEERKIVSEAKSIKVPIPTFPPTAMFYSVPKSPNPERKTVADVEAPSVDIVSAAIMAKVLEERQKEKALTKHCDTCTCAKNLRIIYENTTHTIGTQTGDYSEMLCLKCNENIELTSVGMKIVRNDTSNRSSSKSRETAECTTTTNNIVKVQPNNFLIGSKSLANSSQSSSKKLHNQNVSPKDNIINSNNHVISSELEIYQDVGFNHGNELELSIKKKYKMKEQQNDSMVPIKQTTLQKIELQESVDKTIMKNKDTNCCPVHLQTGAKNILLDNAHSNVASVLEIVKSDSLSLRIESESSKPTPLVYSSVQKLKSEEVAYVNDLSSNVESISSGNGRSISVSTETSVQNQQRVAEWIQSNLDNDVSSSDNSRADSVKSKNIGEVVDRAKYAEMEENVKRFLFGESEFLKKVEIGKLKYQNLQDAEPSNSKKNSCKTDF